jgi:uncharacterized protein (TIGR02757 family)
MRKAIREQLIKYAEQFETEDFIQGDPSWFMHQVRGRLNQEVMAFVASCLSYGSRKQFLPKIQLLLDASQGEPYEWVRSEAYTKIFPDSHLCFYRLYDNRTMLHFMQSLRELITEYGSLGEFVYQAVEKGKPMQGDALRALTALSHYFKSRGLKGIVPQPVTSLCKRPCMFLRWMVRDNSPVDLGIWSDYIDKTSLYIPMDTHVMQTARRLGLVRTKTASWATTEALTREMAKVFPTDPARGDFALYGADALVENPSFST